MIELDITWWRTLRVWWSFVWRNLIAVVCVMIIGGIIGAVIGAVMGSAGASLELIRLVTGVIGGILGLLVTIVPIRLILGMNFGEFRLILIAHEALLDE